MDFKKKYNRIDSINLLGNELLPDDFNVHIENLDIEFKSQFIKKATLLGNAESLKLKAYEIEHTSEHDPRVSLSKEAFKLMASYGTRRALVFFVSPKSKNYRFSLITINLKLEGRRVTKEYSNPRRYSFYLGPDAKVHTPEKFLIQRGEVESWDDLFSRFNVEVVNREFFEQFGKIFERTKKEFQKSNKAICLWLKSQYIGEEYDEQINKFAFTFLGRIIFIYFLQRKGWIEDRPNYIKEYISDESNVSLYKNFFKPLFFDVFAKKENDRPKEIREQYKNTPYLNGGLFERSQMEVELESDAKEICDSTIFDDEFIRDIILNFFEIYNFTIDENSLSDQEVSIDPEMLGKVFENTLAQEERGKKGTFYTPREIVHFMVKESLWQFLQNETDINTKELHSLIYDDNFNLDKLSKTQIRLIDDKLEKIKVLDPAVGSAAFPVEMMHTLVSLRRKLNVKVGVNINKVDLKKSIIQHNIYGVDIDPSAIEIAKLRLWLSLVVDHDKNDAEPLPNLDFQFRLGNSLQEKVAGFEIITDDYLTLRKKHSSIKQTELFNIKKSEQKKLDLGVEETSPIIKEMQKIIDDYFNEENQEKRKQLKEEFDRLEQNIFKARIKDIEKQIDSQRKNSIWDKRGEKMAEKFQAEVNQLKEKMKLGTHKLFIPRLHFFNVFKQKGGFDIVIGNPPWGVPIEEDIKQWHDLGSRDSYGVFISTALKRFLKPNGVLSYIISDTWLTIKTHKQLRKQVLEKQLHKIIRVHQDCFDATVNACIIGLTNSPGKKNNLIVADLTNISTRKEGEKLREKLYHLEDFVGQSTPKFAVYKYKQNLINTNSNLSIFVGSPKLFSLMNNMTCKTIDKEVEGQKIKVRQIKLNGKNIEISNFGATYTKKNNQKNWNNDGVAKIVSGIKTGNNKKYLRISTKVDKNFNAVDKDKILSQREWTKLSNEEKINGINNKNKYYVPFEMGKSSDINNGLLPNYYQEPTTIYINWSKRTVKQMKKEAHSDLANGEFRFKKHLSFSCTGYYAPTFRISVAPIFVNASSGIFFDSFNRNFILGISSSKLIKYLLKNFVNHSVSFEVDNTKDFPFIIGNNNKIIFLVSQIIEKQKQNPRYDYISNEQKEIDKLVYEMYGLNKDDIREVETWYARRYPKLARFCDIKKSQRSNIT